MPAWPALAALADRYPQTLHLIPLDVADLEAARLAAELVGAADDGDGARSLEERLARKGVQPFAVQERKAAEQTTKLVYSTIGVTYQEKDEQFIRQITPRQNFTRLADNTASTIGNTTVLPRRSHGRMLSCQ